MKIFINYRREDEANMAFVIANALMVEFGVGNVFFDRQVIPAGSVFPHEIDKALDNCLIFIAVIGRKWSTIMKERQSFEEKDYVVSEIEHAFEKGVNIVPILVDNATMPPKKELPQKIKELSSINAIYISSDPIRMPLDIHNLTIEIKRIISTIPVKQKPDKPEGGLGKKGYAGEILPGSRTTIQRGAENILHNTAAADVQLKTDELNVVLSDQLEQRSFDKAGKTIAEMLALDRDNQAALNAQALLDKQQGFGIIKNFKGPGTVTDSFFSQDGRKIIAVFGGIASVKSPKPATVIIWDVNTEQKLFEFSPKNANRGWKPNGIDLSPDEQTILLGDVSGIYLVSVKTKDILASHQAGWTECVSFLPEGNRAISGGSELLLWDFELGSVIHRFMGHEGKIQSLAVAPDGKKAVTGGEDATIRLWDLQKKSEIWNIEGFKVNMQCVAISPDGKKILAGGNKIISLIDLNSGKEITSFAAHKGYTLSIAFSPDGLKAMSGGTDNILRYWDLKNGSQLRGYKVTGEWTGSVGFSSDGRYALSSDISNINVWILP